MNHFARFGLEPKPWINTELLQQRFLEFSAEAHPDKNTEKAEAERESQELNAAYNVLRNTRTRLLHLLEIAGAPKQDHVQNVPAEALESFATVAAATKGADALIKEKTATTSPMLKVQLMERALHEIDATQQLQEKLRTRIAASENRLKAMGWSSPPSDGELKVARETAATLGFLERWNAQLQDRIGALTF